MIGVGFDLDDEGNPGIQVVRSKRRQVFADVSHHPHFASQAEHGGDAFADGFVPMIVGDRVIGVISIDKFEPDFYDEERRPRRRSPPRLRWRSRTLACSRPSAPPAAGRNATRGRRVARAR